MFGVARHMDDWCSASIYLTGSLVQRINIFNASLHPDAQSWRLTTALSSICSLWCDTKPLPSAPIQHQAMFGARAEQ